MAFVGGDAGGEVGGAPIEPGHLPPALVAAGAADAAHHLADAFMDARIGFSAGPVGGGDAGPVEPHGGRGDLFGPLGEEAATAAGSAGMSSAPRGRASPDNRIGCATGRPG